MRSLSLFRLLVVCFVGLATPLSADQPEPAPANSGQGHGRPLTAAIERHIGRLLTSPGSDGTREAPLTTAAAIPGTRPPALLQAKVPNPPVDWAAVTRLPRGAEFTLRTDTAIDGRRTFLTADDTALTVLYLEHPALPKSASKLLREMAIGHTTVLLGASSLAIVNYRDISVGAGFISQSGRRLVALDDVLQRIPRGSVREIRVRRTQGSKLGAIGGATVGAIGGLALAPYWMMKPCNGSCADEQFFFAASLVGLPLAGALLGYAPRQHDVVVYRSAVTS